MKLRFATWKDPDGRLFRTLIPDEAPDTEAELGIPAGPPDLSELELPLEVEVRLNNQLFHRSLFDWTDVRRRGGDVMGALLAALKLDAQRVINLYRDREA